MFTARDSLNIAPDGGIIPLWYEANVFETQWKTDGVYGVDNFYYFFIPAGFIFFNEPNTFLYNFGLKYVNKSEKVTGYVEHNGIRQLQEGKTDPFWHLEESAPYEVKLETDQLTKLPFLSVPDTGLPNFMNEKRYFIPLSETA